MKSLPQSRNKEVQIVDLGYLFDEQRDIFSKRPVVQIIQDVEIDSVPSTCQERLSIIASIRQMRPVSKAEWILSCDKRTLTHPS
jgi:hypothetical protein